MHFFFQGIPQQDRNQDKSRAFKVDRPASEVGKKTVDSKTVKVPKKSKVITGLKKAWKVQETKGFITAIDGKKQNPKKKIYWTYTINGKWATKGVNQQKVANKDKVKFTLDKVHIK